MLFTAGSAQATPLRLDYIVNPSGGGYAYQFRLTLDNHDNTWASGQGWGWIVFGDVAWPGPSPLQNFVADPASFPAGPFTGVTSTSGGHNGPTLAPVSVVGGFVYWTPAGAGAYLEWAGTATTLVEQGSLFWSSLLYSGGAKPANFELARRVTSFTGGHAVPEGGDALILLGLALGGLTLMRLGSVDHPWRTVG